MRKRRVSAFVGLLSGGLLAGMLGGCVTAWSLVSGESDELEAQTRAAVSVDLAESDRDQALLDWRVTSRPAYEPWLWARRLGDNLLGGPLDMLLLGNLALATGTFRTEGDAYRIAGLVGLAGWFLDDLLAHSGDAMPLVLQIRDEGRLVRELSWDPRGEVRNRRVTVDWPSSGAATLQALVLNSDGKVVYSRELTPASTARMEPARRPAVRLPPPDLSLDVTLADPERSGLVEGEIGASLRISVANRGGPAKAVRVRAEAVAPVDGLTFDPGVDIGDLDRGQTRLVELPLRAAPQLAAGQAGIRVSVLADRGFDAPPSVIRFRTRPMQLPELEVEASAVDNHLDGVIKRGQELQVLARISNRGQGKARGVEATLAFPERQIREGIIVLDDVLRVGLGTLGPGESAIATWSLLVKNAYAGPDNVPLQVVLTERHEAARRRIGLPLSLNVGSSRIAERTIVPSVVERTPAKPSEDLAVDVDQPLPLRATPDPDAVAVVIGIEQYNIGVPVVPYALRDAAQMREYLSALFGVLPENLIYLTNEQATKGTIQTALEGRLPGLVNPGRSDVYVYYAGHGAPDPDSKAPYLVPFDGNPSYARTSCYPMASFYESLARLQARTVTVMLDACFSGLAGRTDRTIGLLASARPVMIQVQEAALPAGVTLFAAGTGEQVSSGYPEKKHGLFTYFLLKGLRGDARQAGRLTAAGLGTWVQDKVRQQARRQGREQTPVLMGDGGERVLTRL